MTIIKRADLGRPLTWDELDNNFQQVDELTAAASSAVSSASASAVAAAGSATASANSANNASSSAADAAASAASAIDALMNSTFEPSDFDFTSGGTLDTTDRNKAVYNPADNNWYSWSGTLPKIVSAGEDPTVDSNWRPRTDQLLRQELSQPDGIYKSGWERNPLTKAITKAGELLDAMPISIWEKRFVDLITDKPTSDPNTWDWAPAITAGIIAAAQQTEMPLGSATRYSSWYLDFTPGKYIVRSQVKVDLSSITYETGKPLIKVRMNGAYISSAIDKDYAVWFLGCRIDVDGFLFTKEGNINAYYLKLGSEETSNVTAVGGKVSTLRCFGATKGLTFGQAYDIVFDTIYMSGFVAVDDEDTSNPATAIHFLSHVADNCNNMLFNRVHLETSYTANYVAIKADDNKMANQPHHNIKFNGGHIEPHFRGAKWFDLGTSNEINFDTVIFTDNGSNVVEPASYNLGLIGTSVQQFNGCSFQTNNKTTVAYDPSTHKSMLKFYAGNATGREFNACYFSTAFTNVSGAGNLNAAIDATATTNGNNSYSVSNCALNDFNRRVSGHQIFSDISATSRKFIQYVDSNDNSTLKIDYSNIDLSYGAGTTVMSLSPSGLLTTQGGVSSSGSITANAYFNAGINNTTAGNRALDFYPYGNTTRSARILADNGGGLSIISNSAAINYVANSGASTHIFTGTIRPNVTGTYNIGSSAITFNAGYFTSWTIGTASILPTTDNSVDMGSSTLRVKRSYVVSRYYTATVFDSAGSGSPEGSITASVGSTYRRTDGGANSTFYVKEAGTGNTGWVAK
ncbi:TPA: hypothetical protein ACWSRY_004857 [Escherichia coli]